MKDFVSFNKKKGYEDLINYNKDSLSYKFGEVIGQEWDIVDNISLKNSILKDPNMVGKDMVNLSYELVEILKQNPNRVNVSNYKTFPELLNDVLLYAKNELYRTKESVDQIKRYALLMSKKEQPFPIDFLNLDYKNYIIHMNWYKEYFYDIESGKNFYGLKHRKDVVDLFNLAFGYPEGWFPYKLPPRPNNKVLRIPNPNIVHKMIHYKYYNDDKNVNSLIQYLMAFGFWFGLRNPSELAVMKKDMINFDDGYMLVKEPKKYNSVRQIFPEKNIFVGKTRKSLKNYVDNLLPKFETSKSKGYLFVKPSDGSPFNRRYLGKYISTYGKMVFKDFHAYMTREWCACAKLIEARLKGSSDPLGDVKNYLGHSEQKTTEGYVYFADNMYRNFNFDWIKRTLKFDKKIKEESSLKSKQGKKTFVSLGIPSRGKYGPAEASESVIGEVPFETIAKEGCFGFLFNTLKYFFSNFYFFLNFKLYERWPV